MLEISLVKNDVKIRKAAESLIGLVNLNDEKYFNIKYNENLIHSKAFIMNESTFRCIINRKAKNHDKVSRDFINLIDKGSKIICPIEVILSLVNELFSDVETGQIETIYDCLTKFVRIVWSLSSSKKNIVKLALLEECKGLALSDIYAIYLALLSGLPLFSADERSTVALQKISNLGIIKFNE